MANTDIYSPFLAARTSYTWNYSGIVSGANGFYSTGGGFLDNATSYTAFTLTPSSGTITGGTIAVYGYNK